MAKKVEATRLAMSAMALSESRQRLDCFEALVTARIELATWVKQKEEWLGRAMDYLDAHPEDPEHAEKEQRWMQQEVVYKEAFAVLQDALLMEKHLTIGEPRGVQRQLGEAPF